MTKLIFFGTPEYVVPILGALKNASREIIAVVTQPDKPVGRKQILTPSPVKEWALANNIPVLTPEKPEELVTSINVSRYQVDIGILAAYGSLIPQEILDLARYGMLNVHPSLLPKYRGTSPVQAAIASGDKQTGVTIIKMDEKHDHGPILAQLTEDIKPDDTTGTLRARLFEKGAQVLAKILPAYLEGRVTLREQDHSKAIFVRLVKKEYGFIPPHYLAAALNGETVDEEWSIPFVKDLTIRPTPSAISQFVRALDPWPIAYTNVQLTMQNVQVEKHLKILKAHVEKNKLILDQVQLEGKNPVSWKQFKQGYPTASF